MVDFTPYLIRQQAFSRKTFGPGARTLGIVDHIRKELVEILATPLDAEEWADVFTLAVDGALRAGLTPAAINEELQELSAVDLYGPGPVPYLIRVALDMIVQQPEPMLWVHIALLTFDGVGWLQGGPTRFLEIISQKLTKNEARVWPDWRIVGQDKAIEHVRTP